MRSRMRPAHLMLWTVIGCLAFVAESRADVGLRLRAPRRMVNDKTLTIEARIVDSVGRINWKVWEDMGTVSVVRLPARTPVPVTATVFDTHLTVPKQGIRFYNGVGSLSFTLDNGAAEPPGDIEVTVSWNSLTASKVVTVLSNPTWRSLSGTLGGAGLTWGPDENIRITGNASVPAGSTLTINPGTLIMVDTTGGLGAGTLITVSGNLQAVGTETNPIFFFSERGPAAMSLTQSGSASNAECWRGFQHYGGATSTYKHVFLTGAGNGQVVSHPRPPILGFFNTHSFLAEDSVFVDDNGMVFSGQGVGSYTVRRCLVSRVGIGGEFFGNGHTLLIEDTWFTGIGRAPEANNLDGDHLHVDGSASTQMIRRCILADGGDDGIDHSGSTFTVQDTIIHHIRDKCISMTGGLANLKNFLCYFMAAGVRGAANAEHVTINANAAIQTPLTITDSIIWPWSLNTCSGAFSYTDVGNAADLGCGTGNFSADPLFVNSSQHDFNLQPGSPALTAGPGGTRIGWLGFPVAATCQVNADCNDNNPCTYDSCQSNQCSFDPIAGCKPCTTAADCDDGDPCTVDSCNETTDSCDHLPGTPSDEICDNLDNDCDGTTDGFATSCGVGQCASVGVCTAGADSCRWGQPSAELCDNLDNDCDGLVDEDANGVDSDGDGVHNICDNCPTAANTLQDNVDRDRWGDVCDNCVFVPNDDQADLDHDFVGDICDLNDGLLYVRMLSSSMVSYQQEQGFNAFDVYRGDMHTLRATGVYTQDQGVVPWAEQFCGETSGSLEDTDVPAVGRVLYYLVTGEGPGGESSLGARSNGAQRPNDNPCP